MQPWQAMKSLLRVICTNSTLATSQVPVCRVPEVAHGDDPSIYTDLSPLVSCTPASLQSGRFPTPPLPAPATRQTHTPSSPGSLLKSAQITGTKPPLSSWNHLGFHRQTQHTQFTESHVQHEQLVPSTQPNSWTYAFPQTPTDPPTHEL